MFSKIHTSLLIAAIAILTSCNSEQKNTAPQAESEVKKDPHSFAIPKEAVVTHLNLRLKVLFETRMVKGTATYNYTASESADSIRFDIKNLNINGITYEDGSLAPYSIGAEEKYLGQALSIAHKPGNEVINIHYNTTAGADALQFLAPEQTAGKKHPFLFTQSQAILARTWLPCQDSPGIRFTYNAEISVPHGMMAVMSATNPTEISENGVYTFTMEQPIPSYLMALAVGNLEYAKIGDHTGVYAEPEVIESAAFEFEDMEKMLVAAEALYGKYAWEKYDVLVLPPSFPFGGMENPRLTFATPTILAGDKSLTSLVAHELAHSWSGNLVTNDTWNDFWLNEGFTVYFERRIMESLYGAEYAKMLEVLGYQDLQGTLQELNSEDTKLKLDLENRDPDDGLTDVAYEKGYFFLRACEEAVGREKFDAFLKNYFTSNSFKTMDTETFLAILKKDLLNTSELYNTVNPESWIYTEGLPESMPAVESARFNQVNEMLAAFNGGKAAKELETSEWTTHEFLHFIRHLSDKNTLEQFKDLDATFGFTKSGNSEILAAWFQKSIENGYTAVNPALENFLYRVGRRKFLMPLYKALIASNQKEYAHTIYKNSRINYHAVSQNSLDALIGVSIK